MSRQTQILPLSCCYSSWGPWAPCNCPDLPCSPDSGRYNVGCTKRVGLFHSDRSKLQKAGATTHNRRRASKASLPTLTKDTKKQVRGRQSPRAHSLKSPLTSLPSTTLGAHHPFCCGGQCSIIFSFLLMCRVKPFPCPFRELS